MESDVFNPKHRQTGLRVAHIAFASLAALIAANDLADGARLRNEQSVVSRPAGEPIMAIVSLRASRSLIYDAKGWIMRAPVSSGQKGRETPAGIFSVLQKEAEHYSNMYDDAFMPHMQRLTWSGIALHGGALPGYPASHGCIRMPYDFAERLFDADKARHARDRGASRRCARRDRSSGTIPAERQVPGAAAASAAAAEADEAANKADQARLVAITAFTRSDACDGVGAQRGES